MVGGILSARLWAALLLLAPTPPRPAPGPAAPSGGYADTVWRIEEGLPQSTVSSIAQGSDGYLWFGTEEGLVRFDGSTFRVFGRRDGLSCLTVYLVVPDRQGGLWLGGRDCGLTHFHDGRFDHLPTLEGPEVDSVTALAEIEGVLWVGTNHGLARLDGRTFRFEPALGKTVITGLAPDAQGGLWIGASQRLLRLRGGRIEDFSRELGPQPSRINDLSMDDGGRLWVALSDGVLSARNGAFGRMEQEGVRGRDVSSLVRDPEGPVWVGLRDGALLRIVDARVEVVLPPDPSRGAVRSLFRDREGNLWFGTYADGLHLLRPRAFSTIGRPEGMANELAWSVGQDDAGALWVGTPGAGCIGWPTARWRRASRSARARSTASAGTAPAASGSPPATGFATW